MFCPDNIKYQEMDFIGPKNNSQPYDEPPKKSKFIIFYRVEKY